MPMAIAGSFGLLESTHESYSTALARDARRRRDSSHGAPACARATAGDRWSHALSSRSPEFDESQGGVRVLPETVCGVRHQDDVQWVRGGQDWRRLYAFHEGQCTAQDGVDSAPKLCLALRLEHARLAAVPPEVPRDGPEDSSDVGQ